MDISGTGNPSGTLTELSQFTFVGGVDVAGGEAQFDFFDADGFFVSGFIIAFPSAGDNIWNIGAPPAFIIPTSGFVQMTVDPNMSGGVLGRWLIVDESTTTGSIGSSPDDPFGLGNTPSGGPGVFAFRFTITGDPFDDNSCPLTLEVDDNPIASDTYTAEQTITSSGTVPSPNVVVFEAGQSITLEQGFEAANGSTFTARIENCASSFSSGSEGAISITSEGRVFADPFNINNEIEARSNALAVGHEVSVYPNPFSEQTMIEVQLATESDLQVELYDLAGSKVRTIASERNTAAGTHQFTVDASHLEGGMYLLMIRTDDEIKTQKLSLIK
jgi:hypothetical protein